MKTTVRPIALAVATIGLSGSALAIPDLQLDISGGSYDETLEDVVTSDHIFTLYALVKDGAFAAGQQYYLSIAITPKAPELPVPSFGEFKVATNGGSLVNSSSMTSFYGTPPSNPTSPDLAPHSIFPTYYYEIAFSSFAGTSALYNTADNPGGPVAGSGLSYATFDFDTNWLEGGYGLHFDLYTVVPKPANGSPKRSSSTAPTYEIKNAPFSHDASTRIPDGGGTLLGLALGLLGMGGFRKFLSRTA